MVEIPQSTAEKPLTAVDYVAALYQCASVTEVQQFAAGVPPEVREDERFTKGVAARLGALKSLRR